MSLANKRLADGNNYQYATKPLASDGFDPVDIPLLFMAGDYDFVFTDAEVENLRKFIHDGGTILFNAARGRDEFTQAVVREMGKVFPQKRFMRLLARSSDLQRPLSHSAGADDGQRRAVHAAAGSLLASTSARGPRRFWCRSAWGPRGAARSIIRKASTSSASRPSRLGVNLVGLRARQHRVRPVPRAGVSGVRRPHRAGRRLPLRGRRVRGQLGRQPGAAKQRAARA